jgi:hypothetical protein
MLQGCGVGAPAGCCLKDSDCTQGVAGRCEEHLLVAQNFCGGAIAAGNTCIYDECSSDADCKTPPTGAKVAACAPSGALGLLSAGCVYGGCRTDADCTTHPGGQCQYGLAATKGVCNLRYVFFCAYPSDPCQVTSTGTTGCSSPMICVPQDNYDGRLCGAGPPEYP